MTDTISRRQMITQTGVFLGAGLAAGASASAATSMATSKDAAPFRFCLNTGTIMGHNLPIDQEVKIATEAGYDSIEPWMRNISRYAESGKSLADLKKQIADSGLVVESAIGFPAWAVEDEQRRADGLENMRRDMDRVRQIGGSRIAAPPAGISGTSGLDLHKIGDHYRTVLELGRKMAVVPQLEIWGSAKALGTVADAIFVAVAAGHPDACLLLDAFHMYKGGSSFDSMRLLSGVAMHVFHVNDYPADPPREKISDGHRVFPGDGVCPLPKLLRDMHTAGFRGALSLELFNREYWKQDVMVVAKTGLAKMRAVAQEALA